MKANIENRPTIPHCELCGNEIVRFEEYYTDSSGNNLFRATYRCVHCATVYEAIEMEDKPSDT